MKKKKINNSGSTLVIVIVVIAFVSILTTTLLYLANMNFQMKATDYRTKVSFYGSEIPLEEIRMQLTIDASKAAQEAYTDLLLNYGNYATDDGGLRMAQYRDKYMTEFMKLWDARCVDPATGSSSWVYALKKTFNNDDGTDLDNRIKARSYHVVEDNNADDNVYCTTTGCTAHCHIVIDTSPGFTGDRMVKDMVNGWIQLRGIKAVYTENGYTSVIATDFNVEVPEIDWAVNSYLDDASQSDERTPVDFRTCVYYTNWVKQ